MPRTAKTPMNLLIVHSPDAHLMAEVAHAERHQVQTAADYDDAIAWLGRQRFDLLLVPLTGASAAELTAAAARYGVPVWAVAAADQLVQCQADLAGAQDFLQVPVVDLVFRQRLRLHQERGELRRRQTQLENLLRENAALDPLTHLPNRHFAIQNLQLQWQRYRRKAVPFSCILCDLDEFKKSNDAHGQRFGDSVLRTVGTLLKERVRASDLVCRYDGQEFFILCSDTDLKGASLLAERLRARMASLDVGKDFSVSACFAVVQSDACFRTADQLLRAAEDLLASAKGFGPNQLVMFQAP